MAKHPLRWVLGAVVLWGLFQWVYGYNQRRAQFFEDRAAWHQRCDRYVDPATDAPAPGPRGGYVGPRGGYVGVVNEPAQKCANDLMALFEEGRNIDIVADDPTYTHLAAIDRASR